MKSILFVDDDANVLSSLERVFFDMTDDWDLHFYNNASSALELMKENPIDLVISDMKMPDMSGAEFLNTIKQNYPMTIRFILSGYTDKNMILDTVGPADQFFSKPCDPKLLKRSIVSALNSGNIIQGPKQRAITSQLQSLPTLPKLFIELQEILQDPNSSFKEIASLVSRDIVVTAKIFQLVNSAFFGLRNEVSDITRAISYLGLETLKAIILSTKVFNTFSQETIDEFKIDKIYSHSVHVSLLARGMVIQAGGKKKMEDLCSMAGILHDIGKLIYIQNYPELWKESILLSKETGKEQVVFEKQLLDVTHADLGAYLLSTWGMNESIIDMISLHHSPSALDRKLDVVSILYIANKLSCVRQTKVKGNLLRASARFPQMKTTVLQNIDNWYALSASISGGIK